MTTSSMHRLLTPCFFLLVSFHLSCYPYLAPPSCQASSFHLVAALPSTFPSHNIQLPTHILDPLQQWALQHQQARHAAKLFHNSSVSSGISSSSSSASASTSSKKHYVVYREPGCQNIIGFGNRFVGLISAAVFAFALNRPFIVDERQVDGSYQCPSGPCPRCMSSFDEIFQSHLDVRYPTPNSSSSSSSFDSTDTDGLTSSTSSSSFLSVDDPNLSDSQWYASLESALASIPPNPVSFTRSSTPGHDSILRPSSQFPVSGASMWNHAQELMGKLFKYEASQNDDERRCRHENEYEQTAKNGLLHGIRGGRGGKGGNGKSVNDEAADLAGWGNVRGIDSLEGVVHEFTRTHVDPVSGIRTIVIDAYSESAKPAMAHLFSCTNFWEAPQFQQANIVIYSAQLFLPYFLSNPYLAPFLLRTLTHRAFQYMTAFLVPTISTTLTHHLQKRWDDAAQHCDVLYGIHLRRHRFSFYLDDEGEKQLLQCANFASLTPPSLLSPSSSPSSDSSNVTPSPLRQCVYAATDNSVSRDAAHRALASFGFRVLLYSASASISADPSSLSEKYASVVDWFMLRASNDVIITSGSSFGMTAAYAPYVFQEESRRQQPITVLQLADNPWQNGGSCIRLLSPYPLWSNHVHFNMQKICPAFDVTDSIPALPASSSSLSLSSPSPSESLPAVSVSSPSSSTSSSFATSYLQTSRSLSTSSLPLYNVSCSSIGLYTPTQFWFESGVDLFGAPLFLLVVATTMVGRRGYASVQKLLRRKCRRRRGRNLSECDEMMLQSLPGSAYSFCPPASVKLCRQ